MLAGSAMNLLLLLVMLASRWPVGGTQSGSAQLGAAPEPLLGLRAFVQLVKKDGYPGFTTYRLLVQLPTEGQPATLYTIYGDQDAPMIIPAAFTVPPPFGSDIGGTPISLSFSCRFSSCVSLRSM